MPCAAGRLILRSKRLRTILLLVIIGALGAVWWSFSGRRGALTERVAPLLGPNVSRRITNFEYLERRDGRLLFRLLAESNIEDSEGRSRLAGVWLEHYDADGELIETVQGLKARYNPVEQAVLFKGEVVVDLVDETRVLAQELQANLGTGLIRIDGNFELLRDQLEGRGRGLRYQTEIRQMDVSDLESLRFPLAAGEVTAVAKTLTYQLGKGRLLLRDGASLRGPQRALAGDEIELKMTLVQTLKQVEARGQARLDAGTGRHFEGSSIVLFFDDVAGQLTHFVVSGSTDPTSIDQPRQARFVQQGVAGDHQLESNQLVGRAAESSQPALTELTAIGAVSLRSRALGIEDSQARRLVARFSAQTGALEWLRMEGNVELVRHTPGAQRREYLRSRELEVELEEDSSLRRLQAFGAVSLETVDGQTRRDLTAREGIDLRYQGGLLVAALARGEAVLDIRHPSERSVLRAPAMDATFEDGLLKRVQASEGVELEIESGAVRRRTRSQQLEANYRHGLLERALQQGKVRLWESSPEGVIEIQSSQALLEGLAITATGGRVLLRTEQTSEAGRQETLADEIVLDRARGAILARGRVETVSRRGSEPVLVTAGRMEVDRGTGSARYTENPRLAQGPTTVRGEVLTIGSKELTVDGQVRSQLVEQAEGGVRSYDVTSDSMRYVQAEGVVIYRGNVRVRGQELDVTAPEVRLYSSPEHQEIEKIVASGGAVIVEQGRKWSAETATYLPREQRVIVGN